MRDVTTNGRPVSSTEDASKQYSLVSMSSRDKDNKLEFATSDPTLAQLGTASGEP